MTEANENKAKKVGKGVVTRVVAELENTVTAVTELAGTSQDFEAAGARLVGYGANPELVELAVELADARDDAPQA